jgi:hypothetical protein
MGETAVFIGRSKANKCILCSSGIFGYVNYLVEKDRKFILDTLLNGKLLSRAPLRKAFR